MVFGCFNLTPAECIGPCGALASKVMEGEWCT